MPQLASAGFNSSNQIESLNASYARIENVQRRRPAAMTKFNSSGWSRPCWRPRRAGEAFRDTPEQARVRR